MLLERDYVGSKNSRLLLENKTEVKNLDEHISHKIKMMENV